VQHAKRQVYGEYQSYIVPVPVANISVFYLAMVALAKHERYGFLISDNSKITSFEKMLPFTHSFNHSSRFFSTAG